MGRIGLGCLLLATLLAAVACTQPGDDSETQPRPPTAVPPTAVPPPPGWLTFNSGAFSGAIGEAWRVVSMADSGYLSPAQLEALNPASRRYLEGSYKSGEPLDVTIVFLDFDPTIRTTISLKPECATGGVRNGALSGMNQIVALQSQGIKGTPAGTVSYKDRTFDLVAIDLSPIFDTYGAYLRDADCYFQVVLTARHGDVAPLEPFRQFVSMLRADTGQFH